MAHGNDDNMAHGNDDHMAQGNDDKMAQGNDDNMAQGNDYNMAQGNDDNKAHGNDDIIYISSDEECRDIEPSQLSVKRQTFILTFTRRIKYLNWTEVDRDMHQQNEEFE